MFKRCFTRIFHAVRYILGSKGSMHPDIEMYLFLRELTHFSLSTRMTPCNILFSLSVTLQTQLCLSPSVRRRSSFNPRPADDCVSVFRISCCSSLCQKKTTMRWYLGNCGLWGGAPDSTRAPGVSEGEGRHDVSASITSRLAPSKAKVSGQISLYNRQDEKQQPQSDAVCTLRHNGGHICVMFSPTIKPFQYAMKIHLERLWTYYKLVINYSCSHYTWAKFVKF